MMDKVKRYFVTTRWAEKLLAQWIQSIMIAVHMGLGIAIIVGGEARFSIPTYKPLIDVSNDHIWIWGVTIITSAVLMMSPLRIPNIVGLFLGMVWMNIWMVLFAYSTALYPASAATPMIAYGGFALINTALLTARVLDREKV